MANEEFIPKEQVEKYIKRMEQYIEEIPIESMRIAVKMVANVKKYGVACIDWCE